MPSVARLGDALSCGDVIVGGSSNVFINGMPGAVVGTPTAGHPCGPPTTMASGSPASVFINNIPVCVVGSALTPHGTCSNPPHTGVVLVGSPDVIVG